MLVFPLRFLPVLPLFLTGVSHATDPSPTSGETEIRKHLSDFAGEPTTIRLWGEDKGPDDERLFGEETLIEGRDGENRIQIVTLPSITLVPPKDFDGPVPAILVCPGGGYGSLGITSGGMDIVGWLNERDITGVYMKYRVPKRHQGFPMHHHPLQDIQRAVSLLRSRSEELGIDPDKIGAIGFSAGGNLCAMLATNHLPTQRLYEPIDEADRISCRPDFIAMVAPAYLTDPIESDQLRPELAHEQVRRNITPPIFITSAVTDKFTIGSLHFALLLRERRVPVELHIYEKGGHAEGIHEELDNQWPTVFEDWLVRQGVIRSSQTRE